MPAITRDANNNQRYLQQSMTSIIIRDVRNNLWCWQQLAMSTINKNNAYICMNLNRIGLNFAELYWIVLNCAELYRIALFWVIDLSRMNYQEFEQNVSELRRNCAELWELHQIIRITSNLRISIYLIYKNYFYLYKI